MLGFEKFFNLMPLQNLKDVAFSFKGDKIGENKNP